MPVETNPAAAPIASKVQQPQKISNKDSIAVDEGGSRSPFAPETRIDIKNSIADLTSILSQAASVDDVADTSMPPQLLKIIQNTLQTSFSLQETLAQGIGSSLESQRFSFEQLGVLSRILTQMGKADALVDMSDLNKNLGTLLQSIKSFVADNGVAEPALLHKLSFQFLNGIELPETSQKFQAFLSNQSISSGSATSADKGMEIIRQLLQDVLPDKATAFSGKSAMSDIPAGQGAAGKQSAIYSLSNNGNVVCSSIPEETIVQNLGGDSSGQTLVQQPEKSLTSVKQELLPKQFMLDTANSETIFLPQAEQPGQAIVLPAINSALAGLNVGSSRLTDSLQQIFQVQVEQSDPTNAEILPQYVVEDMSVLQQQAAQTQQASEPRYTAPAAIYGQMQSGDVLSAGMAKMQADSGGDLADAFNLLEKMAALIQSEGNTGEMGEAMASAAKLADRGGASLSDVQKMQTLLQVCQGNVPVVVQQAAYRNNLPLLPKLWAFMQLCDLVPLHDFKENDYKKAGKSISMFATALKSGWDDDGVTGTGQKSLNFFLPVYMGENEKSYPAYICVFDEDKEEEKGAGQEKETWLRICVLTDNIGAVELTYQIYGDERFNMRLFFSQDDVATEFKEFVPTLRQYIEEKTSLQLLNLKIGMA